jgi:hypothetical protein
LAHTSAPNANVAGSGFTFAPDDDDDDDDDPSSEDRDDDERDADRLDSTTLIACDSQSRK